MGDGRDLGRDTAQMSEFALRQADRENEDVVLRQSYEEAIRLAEKVRTEDNGVFGVKLFLGHDGHNVCMLEDYNKEIGRGESGHSLLNAVLAALSDWRYRNLLSPSTWARDTVETAIERAIQEFGGGAEGIFNTAGFETAINTDAYAALTGVQIVALLETNPRIVRLHGGYHWLRLPGMYHRCVEKSGSASHAENCICAQCGREGNKANLEGS